MPHLDYAHQKVLILGGLGFIGTHLGRELLRQGAQVTLVDNFLPDHGANPFHLTQMPEAQFHCGDIRSPDAMNQLVQGQDVIFNLAAQTSHSDSMSAPFLDLDINARGNLVVLEACRHHNPGADIVFVGTRAYYGAPEQLPVSEQAGLNPLDIYSVNRYAAEQYHLIYHRHYGLKTRSLRIGNIFGPYAQMAHPKYNVLNFFVRLALEDQPITLYGGGPQKRDYLYVKDAIQALLRAGLTPNSIGQTINIGSGVAHSLYDLVHMLVKQAGSGQVITSDWPPGTQNFDVGDFVMDISLAHALLGWNPQFTLEQGFQETLDFYRKHHAHYWESTGL